MCFSQKEAGMINVAAVSFRAGNKLLVKDISLTVIPGEFVVIMGPNGAGKSTLLKLMSGALPPTDGQVLFNNRRISDYKKASLAKQRAVLSQQYDIGFPLTAGEIVMIGRYPYFKNYPGPGDRAIADTQMETMQVKQLANRSYHTLSGGEAQKIQMSRVLSQIAGSSAQDQKLLLLDEPVSHLDIKYQHELLAVAKQRCTDFVAVVAVLHDVNLALKYADRIVFMKQGIVVKVLSKQESITPQLLKEVFDVTVNVHDLPDGTGKFVAF